MAPSPSEFLTFYRRIASSSIGRGSLNARPAAARPFSSTIASRDVGSDNDKQHATRKDDHLDVQSRASKHGTEAKSQGSGGSATEERDTSGGVAKAKKEHPEAPDPAIGMQDERGGKGH